LAEKWSNGRKDVGTAGLRFEDFDLNGDGLIDRRARTTHKTLF